MYFFWSEIVSPVGIDHGMIGIKGLANPNAAEKLKKSNYNFDLPAYSPNDTIMMDEWRITYEYWNWKYTTNT